MTVERRDVEAVIMEAMSRIASDRQAICFIILVHEENIACGGTAPVEMIAPLLSFAAMYTASTSPMEVIPITVPDKKPGN
jgi:hypothetical protein